MKSTRMLISLLLGTAAFLAAVLALTVTPAARAATSFSDPAGDAGVAPDVTSVSASNDGRILTVVLDATGVSTAGSSDYRYVSVVFDTDRNTATGDDAGMDYFFGFDSDAGVQSTYAYAWAGGDFAEVTPSPVTFGANGDTYAFTVNADELGIGSGFDFLVEAGGYTETSDAFDRAPDMTGDTFDTWSYTLTDAPPVEPVPFESQEEVVGLAGLTETGSIYVHGEDGLWHYVDSATFVALGYDWNTVRWFGELPGSVGEPLPHMVPDSKVTTVPRAPESVTVVVPVIGKGFTTPATVLAGKTVTVSFPVTDADGGTTLTAITSMIGNPKIGGTIVKHVEHFANGWATITLKVPKAATGKSLAVALTVKTADGSASNTATFKIH